MLKAETRSLILGETLARANLPERHTPLQPREPSRMTDTEIETDYRDLTARALNITRQLDDDRQLACGRGDAWRKRAAGARRVYLAEADKLLIEARRRRLAFVAEIEPDPGPRGLNGQPLPAVAPSAKQAARERQAAREAEARARKAAEAQRKEELRRLEVEQAAAKLEAARVRAERHAALLREHAAKREASEARTRRQERLFIEAAQVLLGRDACREIWDRARALHPDPAIWDDVQGDRS